LILSSIANASNKTTAQNWRQQQQDKTENLRAYEAARSLKIANYRTEILSPIENASDKPNKTTENTKEQENMPENSPKSYKNDNSISNESHSVLIENTRRNENELSNQGNLFKGIVNWSGAASSNIFFFFLQTMLAIYCF
jgi:hypothetical protein